MNSSHLNLAYVHSICFFLPLLIACLHIWCSRSYVNKSRKIEIFLIYFMFFNIGIVGVIQAFMEFFLKSTPNYGLGMAQLSFGISGILAMFSRDTGFWLATGTVYSLFLIFNFVYQSIRMSNNHSYDFHTVGPEYYTAILAPLVIWSLFGLLKRYNSKGH